MQNKTAEVDWLILDEHWAEQYEEDYGDVVRKAKLIIHYY